MMTRRGFAARMGLAAAGAGMLAEASYAQRALPGGNLPPDMVWLNANENPAGPPQSALNAMAEVLGSSGRYHYSEFGGLYAALARGEGVEPAQLIVGCGSTEVLHAAVEAFTTPSRPLIAMHPTYEGPRETASGLGRPIVRVPHRPDYAADVRAMVAAADKAGGGLIYLCNPNNPTGAITPAAEIDWLAANLPVNTVALIDEAYIHFGASPQLQSALAHVQRGRNVMVVRTFSKIYGMAGVRAGFGCAPPELIGRISPLRNPISVIALRGVMAALGESGTLLPRRREAMVRGRENLYAWLRERNLRYIESHANFMMIEIGRPAGEFGASMARLGVAVGRPFPPLDHMLRVTIGTDAEMEKFRRVFWQVYQG